VRNGLLGLESGLQGLESGLQGLESGLQLAPRRSAAAEGRTSFLSGGGSLRSAAALAVAGPSLLASLLEATVDARVTPMAPQIFL